MTWLLMRGVNETRVRQHTVHLGNEGGRVNDAIRAQWQLSPAPVVMLVHSYTLLEDVRTFDQAAKDKWNAALEMNCSEYASRAMKLADDVRKVTLQGPHAERMAALTQRLESVLESPGTEALTFSDLSKREPAFLFHDVVVDPVVEFDVVNNAPRMTGLQRYSRSYLEFLDDNGPARAD